MNEEPMLEIVQELKGLRQDFWTQLTGLQQEVKATNQRLDVLQNKVDGLNQSVIVLQQGVAEVRYELRGVKEVFSERVIWQNDNISIATKEGTVIYGIIQKEKKK